VVVTYWGDDEPAYLKDGKSCVLMDSGYGEDDGKWKVRSCREMYSAICKKPLGEFLILTCSIHSPHTAFTCLLQFLY